MARLSPGQTRCLCYVNQYIDVPNVFPFHEVGMEQRIVDPLAVNLRGRPRPQFLCQTAVEGVCPLTVWQTLLDHKPTHTRLRGGDINITAGKQVFESNPLLRRVRMEGEMRPDNLQIIGGPESLNTSRTEITPGSHIVRENFQRDWLWHIALL